MALRLLLICFVWTAYGVSSGVRANESELLEQYHTLKKEFQLTPQLTLKSGNRDDRLTADIYSGVDVGFSVVTSLFQQPEMWCRLLLLNLNIKSCLVDKDKPQTKIIVFAGRKFYEPPEATERFVYQFRPVQITSSFLTIELSAESGPFGTSDYIIRLRAIPDGSGSVLHVHTGYTTSVISRMGSGVYLATLGRDKIGFSVGGHNELGQPIYIDGVRGIIERNAMRYYLSLLTLFQTRDLPEAKRFEAGIKLWFKLTEDYKKQLHELERDEYLDAKRREYQNQQRMQQLLDKGIAIDEILDNDN